MKVTVDVPGVLVPAGYELERAEVTGAPENRVTSIDTGMNISVTIPNFTMVLRKKPPREWWVILNSMGSPVGVRTNQMDADLAANARHGHTFVHVREVLE